MRADLGRRAVVAALLPLVSISRPRIAFAGDEPASAATIARAVWTAGDPRFLQPVFDDIQFLGITATACGSLVDAAGDRVASAVEVQYDASRLGYKRVLGAYLRGIDPTRSAEQGQFGTPGPTIIWTADATERAAAEGGLRRLRFSGLYQKEGNKLLTEVRDVTGLRFEPDAAATGWYLSNAKEYAQMLQRSGRAKWFDDRYKPITTTECERQPEGGTICGYVYFPCTNENGCQAVMQGTW